jgi:hypothetical protein
MSEFGPEEPAQVAAPKPAWYSDSAPDASAKDELFANGIPTVRQRILGVLLMPRETFAAIDGRAGWLVPWAIGAAGGLVVALTALARGVDFGAIVRQQMAEQNAAAPPEAAEFAVRIANVGAHIMLFLWPTLIALFFGLVVGGVIFGLSSFLGGRKDFLRAFTAAMHASLVGLVRDVAAFVGFLSGNPVPQTSPANLAGMKGFAAWALSIVDPIYWWWVVVLFYALHLTMGVERKKALQATAVLSALPLLFGLLATAVGQAFQMKMGHR